MSRLEELEEGLYGKDEGSLAGRRRRHFGLPSVSRDVITRWDSAGKPKSLLQRLPLGKAALFLGLAGFLFLAGGAAFVWFYLDIERREATVTIGGRDLIEGGEAVTIPITFKNTSSIPLQETELVITLPEGSLVQGESGLERLGSPRLVEHVGTLEPGEERTTDITARIFGKEGEPRELTAALWYRPERLRARFSSEARKSFTISRVPLTLLWEAPRTIVPRQDATLTLRFSSQARSNFEDLWIRIDYPPGFAPRETAPKPEVGDILWKIGVLEPGAQGEITLMGTFDGAGGDRQSLHAGIGIFNELSKEWRPWRESSKEITLSAAPLFLQAALDGKREGVIRPGQPLNFTIRYANRTPVPVKNISIRAKLEGEIIDLPTLSIGSGGVFDFQTKTIVWGPGGTPGLQEMGAGEEGELQFRVQTHKSPPVRTSEDRNLLVRARTSITTPQPPKEFEGSELSPEDSVEFKVASVLLFAGRAVFRSSPIINVGPLPPKVGEQTAYTIVWEVRNFTNEFENAEIRGSLPPNVHWEGVISPRDADIRFDSASGEVRWRIGKIPPGTGVLTPALVGAFQVSVIPSEVDVGEAPTLINEAVFKGKDNFTGEGTTQRVETLTTELRDDPTTKSDEWKVAR